MPRVDAAPALGLAFLIIGCGAAQPPQPTQGAQPPPPPTAPSLVVNVPPPLPNLNPPSPRETPPPPPPPARATTTTGVAAAAATPTGPDPLMDKLLGGGGAALKTVLVNPEKYRFQVLYGTVITKQGQGASSIERHSYRADAEYFFPASSMKVPIALATFERLPILRKAKPILTRDAMIRIFPISGRADADPYTTTLARETWRALIVSDNFSANRLLAFVGQREVHETLWSLGLASARVRTGFATGADIDPAEVSPRVEVGSEEIVPERRSNLVLPPNDAKGLGIGEASIVNGRRVEGPLSFAEKNAIRLRDLQDTLVRIMRPDLLLGGNNKAQQSSMSKEDLEYLRQTLGTLPSESGLAGFDRNVVANYQLSPFLRGIERVRPRARFEIYSKVGQAFGFLVANAYVVDKDTGRSFFLTASVYANPDETMNDDKYAYDTISFPALADVGEAFCRHAFTTAP